MPKVTQPMLGRDGFGTRIFWLPFQQRMLRSQMWWNSGIAYAAPAHSHRQHAHHLSAEHPEDMALTLRKGHRPGPDTLALSQHLAVDIWVFLYCYLSPLHLHSLPPSSSPGKGALHFPQGQVPEVPASAEGSLPVLLSVSIL